MAKHKKESRNKDANGAHTSERDSLNADYERMPRELRAELRRRRASARLATNLTRNIARDVSEVLEYFFQVQEERIIDEFLAYQEETSTTVERERHEAMRRRSAAEAKRAEAAEVQKRLDAALSELSEEDQSKVRKAIFGDKKGKLF